MVLIKGKTLLYSLDEEIESHFLIGNENKKDRTFNVNGDFHSDALDFHLNDDGEKILIFPFLPHRRARQARKYFASNYIKKTLWIEKMMQQILSILLLALSAQNVLGFTGPNSPIRNTPLAQEATDLASKHIASAAGFVTGAVGVIGQVVAADEYELAELPPPYVPAIFGLVLLVGVGVLTSSLGNVMDEGEYRWGVFFCIVYIVQARAKPYIFSYRFHCDCRGRFGNAEWSSCEKRNRTKSIVLLWKATEINWTAPGSV